MTVKEFANKFDMSVSELADYTGYSRKTLYNIIEGNAIVNTRRYEAMISNLKRDAWSKMCKEQSERQKRYEEQIKMLEELKTRKRSYPGSDAEETINTSFGPIESESVTLSNYCK